MATGPPIGGQKKLGSFLDGGPHPPRGTRGGPSPPCLHDGGRSAATTVRSRTRLSTRQLTCGQTLRTRTAAPSTTYETLASRVRIPASPPLFRPTQSRSFYAAAPSPPSVHSTLRDFARQRQQRTGINRHRRVELQDERGEAPGGHAAGNHRVGQRPQVAPLGGSRTLHPACYTRAMPLSDLDATVVANTRLSSDLSRAFQVAFSRSSSFSRRSSRSARDAGRSRARPDVLICGASQPCRR